MADNVVFGGGAEPKHANSSTKDGARKYEGMRNKCHRFFEPGYQWFDCTARVIPAAKKSHSGSGEVLGSLTIGMLGKIDAVGGREQSEDGTEKWIADSGATFHMTRSADLLCDLHPTEDEVKIGNDTLIGVDGHGSLTVAFPNKEGGVTVRLEKVAYVPALDLNLFFLMAAHKRGVAVVTDEEDMNVILADGRLRVWSDGSGYSTFVKRIDPHDDYIPFPMSVPGPIENPVHPAPSVPLVFSVRPPVVLTRVRLL